MKTLTICLFVFCIVAVSSKPWMSRHYDCRFNPLQWCCTSGCFFRFNQLIPMQRSDVIRKEAKVDKTKDNIVPPEITPIDGLRDKHESIAPENHLQPYVPYFAPPSI